MNTLHRLVLPLGLLLLAACGAGDPGQDAAVLTPDDDQAALEAADAGRLEPAEEAPTSARFQLGEHYERLAPVQPTSSSPEQVEVTEVFWYGCPHCNAFEPYLASWAAQKPEYVSFVRLPALWNPMLRTHARAFYTAEVLGKLDVMHDAFFAEIHENGNLLDTREALAAFFARFDVEAAEFDEAFDSYEVNSRLQQAEEQNRRYRISSVPTIVINGKYTTNATLAGDYPQLIELIGELAASERPAD